MAKSIKTHKTLVFILLLLVIGGGYYVYRKQASGSSEVRYITALAVRGAIITSVSGSGQISASNQVDLKSKVSGDIIKVAVIDGQEVRAGQTIAQINAREAYKEVRDAQSNLQSAQLSMDKLKQPADSYSIMQAENSLASAKINLEKLKLSQPADYQIALETKQKAEEALSKTYQDAFNAITSALVNFPNIMPSLNDMLYGYQISLSETSVAAGQYNMMALLNSSDVTDLVTDRSKIQLMQNSLEADYKIADEKYLDSLAGYKDISRYFNNLEIENLLAKTAETSKAIAQAIKNIRGYLDAWSDLRTSRDRLIFSKVSEYKANLVTYSELVNGHLTNLTALETLIKNNKNSIEAAKNNIQTLNKNNPLDLATAQAAVKEKQASLVKLKAGADQLDIRTQELSLQQRRNALYDAQTALADYTIKAPFDGVIATVNVRAGDSASGAAPIATVISPQKIAAVSLNEVDVAKIKIKQKATLSFDAIDGLELTGQVAQVDTIGAVSQGVVSYNVKIILDAQDQRIKPGMSVNAAVITNAKTDILTVPNSAVKNNAGGSYIQSLDQNGQPYDRAVQTGLANDTSVEIISGLNEGEKVVTQTITSSAAGNGGAAPRPNSGFGGGPNRIFF